MADAARTDFLATQPRISRRLTAFAAGIVSYQISPRKLPALFSGVGLSLGLFVLFKFLLGLGNIVAYRIPTPAKLWEAISVLIPFVGH